MLHGILDAHGGKLPADVHVVFCNTGKEREETLRFIHDCATNWDVPIVWLQYDENAPNQTAIVGFNSAARNGEPFEALITKRKFLPNAIVRFCTIELKVRRAIKYMRSFGYEDWRNAIGFRADEPTRVFKARARAESANNDGFDPLFPLFAAGVSKRDVTAFWKRQPFDLRLPNINNKTPHGNCDLCFLKGERNIAALIRESPERAKWWIAQEDRIVRSAPSPADGEFRGSFSKRFTYKQLLAYVQAQGELSGLPEGEATDCFCHD